MNSSPPNKKQTSGPGIRPCIPHRLCSRSKPGAVAHGILPMGWVQKWEVLLLARWDNTTKDRICNICIQINIIYSKKYLFSRLTRAYIMLDRQVTSGNPRDPSRTLKAESTIQTTQHLRCLKTSGLESFRIIFGSMSLGKQRLYNAVRISHATLATDWFLRKTWN